MASAAFDRPTRLSAAARELRSGPIAAPRIERAADAAFAEAQPIADTHGSAAYKRELVRVHVGRALRQLLGFEPQGSHA